MTNLTDPIFTDEEAARAHFEAIRWPDGKPVCPHCGALDAATRVAGKSHRAGLIACRACREHYTVTVGTVMERSHIPLNKWALGFHLMASSKKGISAHQLMRNLGLGSYRTAWFMAHRIREAMFDNDPEPLGGKDKTVEVDETYIGKPADTFVSGKGWQSKRGTAQVSTGNGTYIVKAHATTFVLGKLCIFILGRRPSWITAIGGVTLARLWPLPGGQIDLAATDVLTPARVDELAHLVRRSQFPEHG